MVERLTTDEKIGMLWESAAPVPRLGIDKYYYGNEGLHGVMRPGKFTVFPQAIGLAATWDADLVFQVASAISDEARGRWNELDKGKKQYALYSDLLTLWSPTINMARDPRWGRTAETYGEDPYLTSRFAVAFIKGLQGNNPAYIKVVACPKHLAANNEEDNRLAANAVISEKALQEYYLPAFKSSVIEGKVQSIMSAYNKVNWVPSTASRWLLTDVLRKDWGFDGYVVSDCGAACNIYRKHHFTASYEEAAAAAIKAGMDMECSGGCTLLKDYLRLAWEKKLVTDDEINTAVKNILRVRFRLGLFDPAGMNPYDTISPAVIGSKAHQQLALKAAEESIILLKNENKILPLHVKQLHSVAIIGHNAATNEFGGYSGEPENTPVSVLEGIKQLAGSDVNILYVPTKLNQFNLEMIPSDVLQTDNGGKGLSAEYFNNTALEGIPKYRVDAQVNLNNKENPPDPYFPEGKKSVRWTGWLVAPVSGEYTLGMSSDDGVRMWFDGIQKIDSWIDRGEMADTFKTKLEAGKKYKVTIEYYDTGGDAICRLWWRTPFTTEQKYSAQEEAARKSDVVIAVIGTGLYNEREGHDKRNLDLPGDQLAMLKAVYRVNPNIVVVMVTGSQHTIGWIKDSIPGLLNIYFGGEQAGNAVARVLFGKTNPSGKLPLTYYENLALIPAMDKYEVSDGRTYLYYKGKPLYEFGYGLSYTSFSYKNLRITTSLKNNKKVFKISAELENTGIKDGNEVVQLYANYPGAKQSMPVQQLKRFRKIFVPAGKTVKLNFLVAAEDFSFWSENSRKWEIYSGKVMMNLGASSKDIRLKSIIEL